MKVPNPIKQLLKNLVSPQRYTLLTQKVTQVLTPKIKCYALCMNLLREKNGFEIGGPSPVFGRNGLLPIYRVVGTLDNCNFSETTTWEGALSEGPTFFYDKKKPAGYQYIRDAVDLHGIKADSMDFVLSSHNIEHIANPIKALTEWLRILKDDGALILIVPHKEGTFDHLRPVSTLDHLVEDFETGTTEDDLTHLDEIVRLHDLERDPGISDIREFKIRSEKNNENRCLHQHVFDSMSVVQLIDYLGMEICSAEAALPMHIICVAKKLPLCRKADNKKYLTADAEFLLNSPFPSDKG